MACNVVFLVRSAAHASAALCDVEAPRELVIAGAVMSVFAVRADILSDTCYAERMRLSDHKFPSGIEEDLVMLGQPVHEIAARIGLTVEVWEEDGLGIARGCWVPIRDGVVVLLRELDHARDRLGATGPVVWVDSEDAIRFGFDALLRSTLDALSLSREDVTRRPDDTATWLAEIKAYAAKRR